MLHLLRRAMLAAACLGAASAATAEPVAIAAAASAEPMMLAESDEAPRLVVPQAITTTEYLTLSEEQAAAPLQAEDKPAVRQQPAWVAAGSLNSLVAKMSGSAVSNREMECLAGAIYFESKSEPLAGQLAVGQVVANRAKSGRFPSSYCGVVFQKGQFSFVRGQKMPAIERSGAQWRTAVAIAHIVDKALHVSEVGKALFFHARRVAPGWRLTRLKTVGNHIFYR